MGKFDRQILLTGQEKFKRITSKNVIVFGVGGVGGFVCEILVRAGIHNLTVVDFDCVTETNYNRQLIATDFMIGKNKTEAVRERVSLINPHCMLNPVETKLTAENIEEFRLKNYDYVIDCIDDFKAKTALIIYCKKNNIKIISAMGTGNKLGIPQFEVCDIFETENDPLAKKLRKTLKDACVENLTVVYSKQQVVKKQTNPVGSFAPFPAACGIMIASYVLNEFLKDDGKDK